MRAKLHLKSKHLHSLENIVGVFLPGVEVWAYGSRVTGRSHEGSDLDLVLRSPDLKKIPTFDLQRLKKALQESAIPFYVEVRDWATMPERYHDKIRQNHVVLIPASFERIRSA